ncbi:MAG TPA: hypothetical protein VMF59_17120, partial [Bacteroidota bacterium]|nr:hypothetical protein [Bacteroidota bacterium]
FLTPGGARSQERPLYISPLVSYDSFRTPGFDSGVDFGAAAGLRISPSIAVSASVATGTRTVMFDVIGGSESLSARIISAHASLEFLLLGRPGAAGLSAAIGAGRISSTIRAHTVSLGALGSLLIPEQSAARTFFEAGLAGTIPLAPDVALVMLPSVRFYSPISSSPDLSLSGGLRVGVL